MTLLQHISPVIAESNWDHDGFWWFPFGLLSLVVLGTAIWLLVRLLRPAERSGSERARDILAERYARGELSAEEYRERLDELGRHQ